MTNIVGLCIPGAVVLQSDRYHDLPTDQRATQCRGRTLRCRDDCYSSRIHLKVWEHLYNYCISSNSPSINNKSLPAKVNGVLVFYEICFWKVYTKSSYFKIEKTNMLKSLHKKLLFQGWKANMLKRLHKKLLFQGWESKYVLRVYMYSIISIKEENLRF